MKDAGSFKKGFSGKPDETERMSDDAAKAVDVALVVPLAGDAPPEGEAAVPEEGAEAMSPEDAHKEAAWAGRLRKREEELKAMEEKIKAQASATESKPTTDDDMTDKDMMDGDMQAGMNLDGDMESPAAPLVDFSSAPADVQAIVAELDNDWGDGYAAKFAKLAEWMADQKADSKVGPVMQALTSFQDSIGRKEHFGSIKQAHEDYETIMDSPEFGEYLESLDDAARANADATIEQGSTADVIALFDGLKGWLKSRDTDGDDAIDKAAMSAAAGVRSNAYGPVNDNKGGDTMSAFRKGFNQR